MILGLSLHDFVFVCLDCVAVMVLVVEVVYLVCK